MGSIDQFESASDSEIVMGKLEDVCEDIVLRDMYMVDVEKATYKAFEDIDYTPSDNVKKAFDYAWVNSHRDDKLCDFIYKVWRMDS